MALALTLDTMCTPSHDVVAREIEGDIIIVPLTAGIGDANDELYTLNQTGRAVWKRLDGRRTLGDVIALLAEEFDGPQEDLEGDVVGFATEMTRRGILSVSD